MVFLQIHDTARAQESGRQATSDELLEFAEQNHVFDGVIAASDDLGLYKQEQGVELFYGAHVTAGTFEFFGMARTEWPRAATPRLPAGRAARMRDAAQNMDGALQRRPRGTEQNFCAERDGANPNRNHAVALCLP
jgi:hypothetical protein